MRFLADTESTHTPFKNKKKNIELAQAISLLLTACVLFFARHPIATAQTIHIPDPNLRVILESALGKAAGEDITQAEMASLESLDALKSGINDLTGLEFATNLRKIELRGNRISDVSPLKNLTNLTKLRLGTNRKIADISPLKNLTNLTFLDIDSNQIADISPLKNLTNLTWLDLDDNRILDISPLTVLKNLTYLDLDGNHISDVSSLKVLTNLTFLDIDDNEISDIAPLSVLIKLSVLDLEGNKLSDISPLKVLTNLRELDLHNNEISDISPISALTNLRELDLHNNNISDVSPIGVLTNLTILNVSGNQISDFSPIAGLIENLTEYDNSNQTGPPVKAADVNRDGVVNVIDLVIVASNYKNPNFVDAVNSNIYPDVNSDGVINIRDLVAIAAEINPDAAAPIRGERSIESTSLTAEKLTQWIQLTKQLGPDAQAPYIQKGIVVLQKLLVALTYAEETPTETALLANYPNPFNPETWIPYQLAKPAAVNISIYAADGKLVRTLALGYLPTGVYHNKSCAAYWNGQNALGESVASGVYFYTFTADDFTATRKMFIRK